jgi:hypothetical protein
MSYSCDITATKKPEQMYEKIKAILPLNGKGKWADERFSHTHILQTLLKYS